MGMGIDKTVIFDRTNPKSVPHIDFQYEVKPVANFIRISTTKGIEELTDYNGTALDAKRYEWRFRDVCVILAGKIYRGISAECQRGCTLDTMYGEKKFFWNFNKFDEFVAEKFHGLVAGLYSPNYLAGPSGTRETIRDMMTQIEVPTPRVMKNLVHERITVAVTEFSHYDQRHSYWQVNGGDLNSVNFATRVDPYAAFQEISMWVSGVLPQNPNPMVNLTGEKIMVAKHGMDEWSFRRKGKNSK